ncbi:sulfite exporter TauE/SafE family protein [Streptomyces lincolnensis]|uniref:sulfite exporter TauE/SafE family protein n=1 Tax=Streptomyces lincolnensis TaxID=1915 RepID=UPI0037CD9A4B
MPETLLVLLAGLAAGALNAVGGGGTFVALPALVAAGQSPVTANASSTIALVPGAVAGAWVYRRELAPVGPASTRSLTVVSVLGGGLGAALVLALPSESFDAAVPWLLAFATVLFAFGGRLSGALRGTLNRPLAPDSRTVLVIQFVLAVYGGYFGGGVGIMMLAVWSVGLGIDSAAGNPMRIAQLAAIYVSATALFLAVSDARSSPLVLATMVAGAVAGGFGGAHLARRLPARLLRAVVLSTAVTMTVLYFLRG